MNKQEAQHIAAEVHGIRPDWAEPGIMAALVKLQARDADACMHAATTAAKNRTDQRTPSIIAMDGDHWNGTRYGRQTTTPPAYSNAPKCHICGRTRPAHDTAESKVPDHMRHEWESDNDLASAKRTHRPLTVAPLKVAA